MTILYSDNFDADTVGSIAPGWANAAGTWAVGTTAPVSSPNSFGSSSKGAGDAALYTGTSAIADMSAYYEQIIPSTTSGGNYPLVGTIVRSDSGYANCYAVVMQMLSSGTIQVLLFKRVGGAFSQIGSGNAAGFVIGNTVSVRTAIQGSTLSAKVWLTSNTEPSSPTVTLTDTSVTAAGYMGLYNGAASVPMAVDNLALSNFASVAATAVTASGPNSGIVSVASTNFTVGVNGSLASAVIVTPSDGGAGGTFTPTTVTVPSGSNPASQTFTYAPSSTGAKTISFTNNGSLTNPSNLTYTATASGISVAPNNAAIVYSPGNWDVSGTRALSVNAGAYLSSLFTGSTCVLNFNIASLSAPYPEIYYRIDGYSAQSPWTQATLSASTISVTMPSNTSALPYHLLEIVIKSTTSTVNRWNSPSNTAVQFTGLTLASGAAVLMPGSAPNGSVVFFGDSITEGVRTVNYSAANDTDSSDAMMGWAYAQRSLLGAEVGIIGFGGSGLTVTGPGNVPVLSTSLGSIMAGVSRNTAIPNLKLIVLNEGTNDVNASAASVTSGLTAALNGLLSAYPNVPIAVLQTFGNFQSAALQSGIAACSNPSLVHWVSTSGVFNTAYGADNANLHPSGPNNLGIIAPQVAAALKSLMQGTSSARTYTFH